MLLGGSFTSQKNFGRRKPVNYTCHLSPSLQSAQVRSLALCCGINCDSYIFLFYFLTHVYQTGENVLFHICLYILGEYHGVGPCCKFAYALYLSRLAVNEIKVCASSSSSSCNVQRDGSSGKYHISCFFKSFFHVYTRLLVKLFFFFLSTSFSFYI
jgi:hypothetical protein